MVRKRIVKSPFGKNEFTVTDIISTMVAYASDTEQYEEHLEFFHDWSKDKYTLMFKRNYIQLEHKDKTYIIAYDNVTSFNRSSGFVATDNNGASISLPLFYASPDVSTTLPKELQRYDSNSNIRSLIEKWSSPSQTTTPLKEFNNEDLKLHKAVIVVPCLVIALFLILGIFSYDWGAAFLTTLITVGVGLICWGCACLRKPKHKRWICRDPDAYVNQRKTAFDRKNCLLLCHVGARYIPLFPSNENDSDSYLKLLLNNLAYSYNHWGSAILSRPLELTKKPTSPYAAAIIGDAVGGPVVGYVAAQEAADQRRAFNAAAAQTHINAMNADKKIASAQNEVESLYQSIEAKLNQNTIAKTDWKNRKRREAIYDILDGRAQIEYTRK